MKHMGVFGGALLVAGTSIGAGMLGLPVVMGACGFWPAVVVLGLCWLYMMLTGLLYGELACHYKNEVNVLGMARRTLGSSGGVIATMCYLALFYALLVAYFVGGGGVLADVCGESGGTGWIVLLGCLLVPVVAWGRSAVDMTNRVLMWGLVVAYVAFVAIGSRFISWEQLGRSGWSMGYMALPVAFVSFGYQGSVPTLALWMGYDGRKVKQAIVWGTLGTLVIYLLWILLVLGIVPYEGAHGLREALAKGRDAVHPLQFVTQSGWVHGVSKAFALCAIVTSFLGVGAGMMGFLREVLGVGGRVRDAAVLLAVTFLPPLGFAIAYPHVFLAALGFAGGFGSALLLGGLPIVMLARAKALGQPVGQGVLGKKELLYALGAFTLVEVACECLLVGG